MIQLKTSDREGEQDGQALKADLAYPENKTFNNTYTAPQPAKLKFQLARF